MNINWIVRIKNKAFWCTLIPMVLLLIKQVAAIFGYQIDFGDLGNQLIAAVGTIFALLALVGIVNDPTTEGLSDSHLAMTYEEPKKKGA